MNGDTAISLASAIVALAALFVSVWSSWATRRHHRLSVRPHLTLSQKVSANAPQVEIKLTNNGLGPAIITSIRAFVDDVEQPLTRPEYWEAIISKLRIVTERISGYTTQGDVALRPGGTISLANVDVPENQVDHAALQGELARVRIEVAYKSMYGEKFKEVN